MFVKPILGRYHNNRVINIKLQCPKQCNQVITRSLFDIYWKYTTACARDGGLWRYLFGFKFDLCSTPVLVLMDLAALQPGYISRSHEVSKPRDLCLNMSDSPEISHVSRWHGFQSSSQISKRSHQFSIHSRSFETLRSCDKTTYAMLQSPPGCYSTVPGGRPFGSMRLSWCCLFSITILSPEDMLNTCWIRAYSSHPFQCQQELPSAQPRLCH